VGTWPAAPRRTAAAGGVRHRAPSGHGAL